VSAFLKEDSAIRDASAILAVIKKIADYRSIKLNNSPTLDILVPSKECQLGCPSGVVPAKSQAVGRTTVNATGLESNVERSANA